MLHIARSVTKSGTLEGIGHRPALSSLCLSTPTSPTPTALTTMTALARVLTCLLARLLAGFGGGGVSGVVVKPKRKADAVASNVYIHDLDFDYLAGADNVVRVGNEAVAHRGDVHEAVLVNADIHKRAEGSDVGHGAL